MRRSTQRTAAVTAVTAGSALLAGALAAAAILVAGATPARAFSDLDRPYGTPELGASARSRAMGGVGVALGNGAFSLVDNPAALLLARGRRLDFAASLVRASENRFVPLFDTFDSYVVETAIAVNDHAYGGMGGGYAADPWGERGPAVAVGLFERYDPRYDYYDERRSVTTDAIVSERTMRTAGVLRTASAGAAWPIGTGSGLGAAVHYYFGTITDRDALVAYGAGGSAAVSRLERRLHGVSGILGATIRAGNRLQLGASFETAPRLHQDFTSWQGDSVTSAPRSNGDLELPSRAQVGGTYRPRNALRTTFAFDLVYRPWSKTEDDLTPGRALEDTWQACFGLEHVFYNNLPGRIGFRYGRSYGQRGADAATFTFGFGYRVDRLRLDLAGEVGKRESRQAPVWPRADQGPAVGLGQDRVEDTLARVSLGTAIEF